MIINMYRNCMMKKLQLGTTQPQIGSNQYSIHKSYITKLQL